MNCDDARAERLRRAQLEPRALLALLEQRQPATEDHRLQREPPLVDEIRRRKRAREGRAAEDHDVATCLLLLRAQRADDVIADHAHVRILRRRQRARRDDLLHAVVPTRVTLRVRAGIGRVTRGGPVALHHFVRDPSIDGEVDAVDERISVIGELVVEDDEVHVPIGTRHEAIERDVSERDDVAHVQFVLSPDAYHMVVSEVLPLTADPTETVLSDFPPGRFGHYLVAHYPLQQEPCSLSRGGQRMFRRMVVIRTCCRGGDGVGCGAVAATVQASRTECFAQWPSAHQRLEGLLRSLRRAGQVQDQLRCC